LDAGNVAVNENGGSVNACEQTIKMPAFGPSEPEYLTQYWTEMPVIPFLATSMSSGGASAPQVIK
jgi:hypothetical protein